MIVIKFGIQKSVPGKLIIFVYTNPIICKTFWGIFLQVFGFLKQSISSNILQKSEQRKNLSSQHRLFWKILHLYLWYFLAKCELLQTSKMLDSTQIMFASF